MSSISRNFPYIQVSPGEQCKQGFYCPEGSSVMRQCDAGKTCPRKGLSEPAGECPPGKFCPIGELK